MFRDLPVSLTDSQRATLDAYVGQMERVNQRVNLVARPASRAAASEHTSSALPRSTLGKEFMRLV